MRGCSEKRRIGLASRFVPHCKNRLRRERCLVILRARRASFFGHNAAHANYKNAACRQRHLLLKARRAKPELAQAVRTATENRGVILASPKRSYTGMACESEERLAILNTAKVGG